MDRFVVKLDKNSANTTKKSFNGSYARQATLKSLKGVVVIEDIEKYAKILKDKESSSSSIISVLEKLKLKNPSREILQSTSIGKSVRKLCKHEDLKISRLANKVYMKWKQHVITVSVKPQRLDSYDQETENIRINARKWLASAMSIKACEELVKNIEECVFKENKTLVGKNYKRNIRKIYLKVKGNEELLAELTTESSQSLQEILLKIIKST